MDSDNHGALRFRSSRRSLLRGYNRSPSTGRRPAGSPYVIFRARHLRWTSRPFGYPLVAITLFALRHPRPSGYDQVAITPCLHRVILSLLALTESQTTALLVLDYSQSVAIDSEPNGGLSLLRHLVAQHHFSACLR